MTSLQYGNCIIAAAYLLIRLREVDHVLVLKGTRWPLHLMVYRRKGWYWHFDWLPPPEKKKGFHPWYFEGRLVPVRRNALEASIYKRRRRIVGVIYRTNWLLVGLLFLFAVMTLPWFIGWFCYGILDVAYWSSDAVLRRK